MSGERWAAWLDRAVDTVMAQCVDLDPELPGHTRRRGSDGRSTWIEPTASHVTSEAVLAQEQHLASLPWTDEHDGQLLIDSSIEITKRGAGAPELREAARKTAKVRTVTLDADTVEMIDRLRRARDPYGSRVDDARTSEC